jgi:transposase-like protein
MKIFNDLKTRAEGTVLIAVTDGLKGIGEALGAVFPATMNGRPASCAARRASRAPPHPPHRYWAAVMNWPNDSHQTMTVL